MCLSPRVAFVDMSEVEQKGASRQAYLSRRVLPCGSNVLPPTARHLLERSSHWLYRQQALLNKRVAWCKDPQNLTERRDQSVNRRAGNQLQNAAAYRVEGFDDRAPRPARQCQ